MLTTIALAAGMLAATPSDPPSGPDLATYRAASARLGRDPEAHVKLALWCEAHGLSAERLKHLALAVLIDPSNARARGLLGLVIDRGAWRRPEAVAGRLRDDARLSAALAEYNARREGMADTAQAHWKLGLWCERNGLSPEAEAHFTAVTRLAPGRDEAWEKLGCRRYKGRWLKAEQVAAEEAEDAAQARADRYWRGELARCKDALRNVSGYKEARAALAQVNDPRAVRAVWDVFATAGPNGQSVALPILARTDGPAASQALACLAVFSAWPEFRRGAADALARRDPHDFVDFLIGLIREAINYEVRHVSGDGPGVLLIESERARTCRVYDPPVPIVFFTPKAFTDLTDPVRIAGALGKLQSQWNVAMGTSALNAERKLLADIDRVDQLNEAIGRHNERIAELLNRYIGRPEDRDPGTDRDAWSDWWADQAGYPPYVRARPRRKPIVTRVAALAPPPPIRFSASSCFVPGTPVHTREGPRPIESLRVGDVVLAQDTATGALAFRPVVATMDRIAPTLRIAFAGEALVATEIHRFWVAGKGWAMARELKAGDVLRLRDGLAAIASIAPERTQRVHNLEVAEDRTYFVGRAGALVHDNSPAPAVVAPFDAVADPGAPAAPPPG